MKPRVALKHMILVTEDGKPPTHLCDVHSWNDNSQAVEHGVTHKLQVTKRYTPSELIVNLKRFRLTLSPSADVTRVRPFLDRLRRHKQAAVVLLNSRGWVGYLLPHATELKLYCHFHRQPNLDVGHQQVRPQQQPKMSSLELIQRGPWTSRKAVTWNEGGGGLEGPDYDPALVYRLEELDVYRGIPEPPPRTDSAPPSPYSDGDNQISSLMDGVRRAHGGLSSMHVGNRRGQGGQTTPGRRDGALSAQEQAAARYGEEIRTESQQASSFIYHLKRFNNWVKSTLISKASKDPARSGLRVLDLACGKGGDLGKWAAHPDGVEKYVASDIARGSLEHLVERMASKGGRMNWRNVPVKLFEADLGRHDVQCDRLPVWENAGGRASEWDANEWDNRVPLNAGDLFDVASMQFALHYMGQTEARMRRFLHEVSRHLRVGGLFVATTMDSRVLIQLLMGHAEQCWDPSLGRTSLKVEIEDERKHNLLSITFKDSHGSYLRKHSLERDPCGPFGLEYTFTLRETELNKNAVDEVPEWMLPLDALKDAAKDYGLDLVTAQNFHEFYAQESQQDPARQNLRNMHVFNPQGSMNNTEWRIAGIYMALVFKKTSTNVQSVGACTPPSPPLPAPRQYPPASPKAPPPDWDGPPPQFQPKSPDHPPPDLPTMSGDCMNISDKDGNYAPRSPPSPPRDMGFAPMSPTSPPPDVDSDEDDMYDKALAAARGAVPPEEWDAFSPDNKKACIEKQMAVLKAANGLSP